MNEHDSEIIINRLLLGELPENVANDFPLHKEEVLSSARTLSQFMQLRNLRPVEDGLRRTFATVRTSDVRESVPSPFSFVQFTRTSFIYKSAFVFPLLFIVLIASGAYLIPWGKSSTTPPTETPDAENINNSGTSLAMDARSMKSAGIQAATFSQSSSPTLPADQDLASVFGPEIVTNSQATETDHAEAATVADDTSGTESYNTIYDAQAF